MDYALKESSTKFENILGTALKVPGVRVDREQFLLLTLGSKIKNENIVNLAIKTDPVTAGISIDKLDRIANLLIRKRTTNKQVLTRTSRRALSKTALYSITKKMGEIIGVKVTKAGFAKGVSKSVPIVGGIISGGTSYVSMNHMGHRLSEVLSDSIYYTEADYEKDFNEICNKAVEVKFD